MALVCQGQVTWHHVQQRDKFNSMFLTDKQRCMQHLLWLLCLAFVVYGNGVDYRMKPELLGHVHNSRIKWKARNVSREIQPL